MKLRNCLRVSRFSGDATLVSTKYLSSSLRRRCNVAGDAGSTSILLNGTVLWNIKGNWRQKCEIFEVSVCACVARSYPVWDWPCCFRTPSNCSWLFHTELGGKNVFLKAVPVHRHQQTGCIFAFQAFIFKKKYCIEWKRKLVLKFLCIDISYYLCCIFY